MSSKIRPFFFTVFVACSLLEDKKIVKQSIRRFFNPLSLAAKSLVLALANGRMRNDGSVDH
jgi:hypothetical protein